ncbi:hypothetical protein BDZ89DRAFT_1193453 [Hymenopellis radicata]|nr:hypothetical protein BDZ89DRAFT_1193453 [Hymenopellis radicata]
MHHRVSFHLQPRTLSPAPKRLHMHPLLASTPSHRAPIAYDVRYMPSARGVGEGLLNQPATDPPTYTALQVVIGATQMRWKWMLTVYPPISPACPSMPISNLHLLTSIYAFLATPLTYADWLALGPQQQRIVTEAYEARCRMSEEQSKRLSKGKNQEGIYTMVGGWREGARRMDCLGSRTCLVGVESDRWGTLRLVFA